MKLYILTDGLSYEGESLLLLTDDLEAAKALPATPEALSPEYGSSPDYFRIYEAEPGVKPQPILENDVARGWDNTADRPTIALKGWTRL